MSSKERLQMISYSIEVSDAAENDHREIVSQLKISSKDASLVQESISQIKNAIRPLSPQPDSFDHVVDKHLAAFGMRKIVQDGRIIFYTFDDERKSVLIVRIFYDRRNWTEFV